VSRLPSLVERLVLAAQAVCPDLRLAGGAGLALLLEHRHSDDIDLFCSSSDDVEIVAQTLEATARAGGTKLARVRKGPTFIRFEGQGDEAPIRVDVAQDAAPRVATAPVMVRGIKVESLPDQRANKLSAVLGRSALRDLVDLFFLSKAGWPPLEGLADATAKDGGMDPGWLAWALSQIEIAPLPGMLVELDLGELRGFRDELVANLLDVAGARGELS
jgi:hypothetical protein